MAILISIAVGMVWALLAAFFKKPKVAQSGNGKKSATTGPTNKIVPLNQIDAFLIISNPKTHEIIEVNYFTQNGNLDRQTYVATRQQAVKELASQFSRMREGSVRVWSNNSISCDVRRPYGSFSGKNEGKKIGGLTLRIVSST